MQSVEHELQNATRLLEKTVVQGILFHRSEIGLTKTEVVLLSWKKEQRGAFNLGLVYNSVFVSALAQIYYVKLVCIELISPR